MGNLKRSHLIEAGLWLAVAAVGYYYTFDFDQNIEIYKFGASGWPRAVLALIVIATLGNLIWHYLHGDIEDPAALPMDPPSPATSNSTPDATASPAHSTEGTQSNQTQLIESEIPRDVNESTLAYVARIVPIILLPFLYAYFLEGFGFYTLTPIFIALVIYLMGERGALKILAVTALIYGLLLLLFAKVLFVGLPVGIRHPFYDYSQWLIETIQNNFILEFLGLVFLIPATLFSITRTKRETPVKTAALKAGMIYVIMLALGTGAAYLLGGRERMFALFDVIKWPFTLIF